jgi:hypothetical protein
MAYKMIALKPGTYDQVVEVGTKNESFDKVILKLLAAYRGMGRVKPPGVTAAAVQEGSENAEARRRQAADPARIAPEHSGVEGVYKVCLPETVKEATKGEAEQCGYRRRGRYCFRSDRRPTGCWLNPEAFNSLPTEQVTLSGNPPG